MVTLGRSRKGLGGGYRRGKGKKILAKTPTVLGNCRAKAFLFLYSCFCLSLTNGDREMETSST